MLLFFAVIPFSANVLLLKAYGWEILIIESFIGNTFSIKSRDRRGTQTHYPVSNTDQLS